MIYWYFLTESLHLLDMSEFSSACVCEWMSDKSLELELHVTWIPYKYFRDDMNVLICYHYKRYLAKNRNELSTNLELTNIIIQNPILLQLQQQQLLRYYLLISNILTKLIICIKYFWFKILHFSRISWKELKRKMVGTEVPYDQLH